MREKLKRIPKPELYVFGGIAVFLLIKFCLTTVFTFNSTHFLNTYKLVFSDSYDWVANGVRIFESDGISWRNPGLVLIIKLLHGSHLLFLLPLLGNIAFFGMVVYLYRLCRLAASRAVCLGLIVFIALNYSFNAGADVILADMYAASFLTMSFFYLVRERYWWSIFLLNMSILFQNVGYFILLIWFGVFAVAHWKTLRRKFIKRDYAYFFRGGIWLGLALLPAGLWNLYKLIRFGDPLYSRVAQIELLTPNLNSIDFYAFNAITMFGVIIIPLAVYLLVKYKSVLSQRVLLLSLIGIAFNFVFWVIFYEWDDRRFLVYFIPFLYPLVAFLLQAAAKVHMKYAWLLMLLLYPTILPLGTYLTSNEMPLFHNVYATPGGGKMGLDLKARKGYGNILMNLNPTLYTAVHSYKSNHTPGTTIYSRYSRYLNNNYDPATNSVCLDREHGIKSYPARTVLMIDKGIDLEQVNVSTACDAKN